MVQKYNFYLKNNNIFLKENEDDRYGCLKLSHLNSL